VRYCRVAQPLLAFALTEPTVRRYPEAGRAGVGKPTSVRVHWAALVICFSCAISSALSAADRSRSAPHRGGAVVQLNLDFSDLPDPPGGLFGRASHRAFGNSSTNSRAVRRSRSWRA